MEVVGFIRIILMPLQVVNTATLACSFGTSPSKLVVTPEKRIFCGNQPAANILDHIPMKNIMPFGMCTTPTNPSVASATAAAMGALTPLPCMPATTSPWIPGVPTVVLASQPAVDNMCKLMCQWAGVITVVEPGQQTVMIP